MDPNIFLVAFFVIIGIMRGILPLLLGWLLLHFLHSKPPGRRMVTSDINVAAYILFESGLFVSSIVFISRLLFGPFPFIVVFIYIIFLKAVYLISFGILNVSALLQTGVILDIR